MNRVALHRLLLPVLLLGPLACSGAGGRGGFQMPPMPVEVADVAEDAILDRFRALGTVEAREIVQVVSEVSGVVRSMPFAEGQAVRRGQLLVQLDDVEIGAEARRAQALRDQARVNHERVKQLFEQKAAAPQELDNASAALKVAEADADLADARLSKTRILSTLDGLVGVRRVSPGAFLRIGDVITEVAALDVVKIAFAVPERLAGQLRSGATVEVSAAAWPDHTFRGRVSVVDPILDPATRTVKLVATIANPGRRLRPGMSANVSATLAERPRALTVPDEAVFSQGDQSFVFVIKPDSSVARQAVVLGSREAARVEVREGLKAGDRVVRAGHQKLFDGAKVMPMPAGGGAPGAAPAAGAAGGH